MILLGGVALKVKMLDGGKEYKLRLPESAPHVFTALCDAVDLAQADCSVYLMPASLNFPAIDCLLSPKLLLQVRYAFLLRCGWLWVGTRYCRMGWKETPNACRITPVVGCHTWGHTWGQKLEARLKLKWHACT